MVKRHLQTVAKLWCNPPRLISAPQAYWCIVTTLETAGLKTLPYHAYVPSFGEWGYVMASLQDDFKIPDAYQVPTRFLDKTTTAQMFVFPKDMPRLNVEANHLNTQKLVEYFESDWRAVMR